MALDSPKEPTKNNTNTQEKEKKKRKEGQKNNTTREEGEAMRGGVREVTKQKTRTG